MQRPVPKRKTSSRTIVHYAVLWLLLGLCAGAHGESSSATGGQSASARVSFRIVIRPYIGVGADTTGARQSISNLPGFYHQLPIVQSDRGQSTPRLVVFP